MPKGGTAMFALLSLAGDLGCTAGPTLVGQVSAACSGSLTSGLCCAVVFPLVLIIALALLGKTGKQV
jgi:MFS-type transporter involved in bile tolerance (Atg22 family)